MSPLAKDPAPAPTPPGPPKFFSVSVRAVPRRDQVENPFFLIATWDMKGVQVKVGDKTGVSGVVVTEKQLNAMKLNRFLVVLDFKEVPNPDAPVAPVVAPPAPAPAPAPDEEPVTKSTRSKKS